VYYVMSRGHERAALLRDEKDRELFLALLWAGREVGTAFGVKAARVATSSAQSRAIRPQPSLTESHGFAKS